MILKILLFISIIFFTGLALAAILLRNKTELLPTLEKLPRAKWAGIILTALVLLWCIPHIDAVLHPTSFFRTILYPGLFIAWILCSIYLDYLFARAFAVFCILYSYTMLHLCFSAMLPLTSLSAIFYYLVGIGGLTVAAKPYWLRDAIRTIMQNKTVFYTFLTLCLYGVLCQIVILVFAFGQQ